MPYTVYVSLQNDDTIATYDLDRESGALSGRREIKLEGGPAALAVDPGQRFLYCSLRRSKEYASLAIGERGALQLLGKIPVEADACYIKTDRTGRTLLSASYGGGVIGSFRIGGEGVIISPPVQWIATARGAHCIQTDRSNRFVFVPHIHGNGPNRIYQFLFDAETGALTPNDPPTVEPPGPLGPRHYAFHPRLNIVYFDNEQGSSVTAYRLDPEKGTLSPWHTVSTLPEGWQGQNTCAQCWIHPSGRFLYASNRGHDSIACFTLDEKTGALTSLGQQPTEKTPRVFGLDPEGRFLLAAGQGSGRMASYRIREDGTLSPLEVYEVGNNPMWVTILDLD
ncbi:MAG: lactonase family protein [Chloroflexi bacterium]|nr:lactonase family protein [Chloroflexota bacterium]